MAPDTAPPRQLPAGHRNCLLGAADFLWDAVRVLALVVIPLGWGLLLVVASLVDYGHQWAAAVLIGAVFTFGVTLAVVGTRSRRPRHARPPDSRAIQRRAWIILPIAGVALATVMAGIAVKPVLLGMLGGVVGLYAVIVAIRYGLHLLGRVVRQCGARLGDRRCGE